MTSTKKQILITLAGGILCIVLLGGIKALQIVNAIAEGAKHAPPPDAVTSVVVAEKEWLRQIHSVGSLTPVQGATISAEEPGRVVAIRAESGSLVEKGALLIELDTSVEEADLKAAEANAVRAKLALDRGRTLRSNNAMAQADLENAEANFKQGVAQVESLRAKIAKKRIVAPFAGRLGIKMVNVGEYIEAGKPLIPLHALDRLYVKFAVPQSEVSNLKTGATLRVSTTTGTSLSAGGIVNAINPNIDMSTRTVEVQGVIDNKGEALRPGMFVSVEITQVEQDKVIPLPLTAINYAPYGDSVYVVETMKDPAGKEYRGVRQQIIKLGNRRGDEVAVLSGLTPGQEIITTGIFKLRPGAPVNIQNEIAAKPVTAAELSDT